MKNLVIFASGAGSNAENIMRYFRDSTTTNVRSVFTNKVEAAVVQKALRYNVPANIITRESLSNGQVLTDLLAINPDLIILAGFLLQFPETIITNFPNKIVNIHPSLLPKYGGKGMYGMHVHRAIIDNRETQTGITIHYVDEHYDQGDIIFQKAITLTGNETCDEIAAKVQKLEHDYFPSVIQQILEQKK